MIGLEGLEGIEGVEGIAGSYHLSSITGAFPPRWGRLLATHGNAMGLVPFKTVSPEGAPQEDATIWNGPGRLECPYRAYFKPNHIPTALPWAVSELPLAGASDLAEVPASFLKNSARLIHGIPIDKNPEN